MPSVVKSVLYNIGVFLADNGVRRNIGSYAYSYTSPTASVVSNVFTLNPAQVFTWNTPMTSSSSTLISSNGPVDLSFTLRPAGSYSVSASKLHMLDSDVGQVVITNSGAVAVNVNIIQS